MDFLQKPPAAEQQSRGEPQIGRLQAVPRTPLSPHWQPQKERFTADNLTGLQSRGEPQIGRL